MKRLFLLLIAAVLLLGVAAAEDEWYYNLFPDGSAEIRGFSRAVAELIVPAEVDGHPVTAIADEAFAYLDDHCGGDNSVPLVSVVLPEGLTRIGDLAFEGRDSLTSIVLPSTLISIGEDAFRGAGFTEIDIPRGVSFVGEGAFALCQELRTIRLDDDHPLLELVDGALFNRAEKSLIWYPYNREDPRYDVPPGTRAIGPQVFYEQESLREITLPESLREIGFWAFACCSNLERIKLPDGVSAIDWGAFDSCVSLREIALPANLIVLRNDTFFGCRNLASVSFPAGLTAIGDHAFQRCAALTEIELPESLTSIGGMAFCGCSSLSRVKLPDGLKSIEAGAFDSCSCLATLRLPDSLTYIGTDFGMASFNTAFDGCSDLVLIVSPGSYAEDYCARHGLIYKTEKCPMPGVAAKEERWSYSLRSDGSAVIYNYSGKVAELTIPAEVDGHPVTAIGDRAFTGDMWTWYRYSGLTSVTLPEGLTHIGDGAFKGQELLTSVSLPSTLISIGESAFKQTGLREIEIPRGVSYLGADAFTLCYGLTAIRLDDDHPLLQLIDGALFNRATQSLIWYPFCREDPRYDVPPGTRAIGPDVFSDHPCLREITLPDGLTEIGKNAFARCESLERVILPDSVFVIGDAAFDSCVNLREIALPANLIVLQNKVFSGCRSLASVSFPAGLTAIDYRAFRGCASLTEITLPDSLTSIGVSAFADCSSLSRVALPDGLRSIDDSVFQSCTSLISLRLPASLSRLGTRNNDKRVFTAFDGCPDLVLIVSPGSRAEEYCFAHGLNYQTEE